MQPTFGNSVFLNNSKKRLGILMRKQENGFLKSSHPSPECYSWWHPGEGVTMKINWSSSVDPINVNILSVLFSQASASAGSVVPKNSFAPNCRSSLISLLRDLGSCLWVPCSDVVGGVRVNSGDACETSSECLDSAEPSILCASCDCDSMILLK